jgi:hypothetical protein
MQVMVLYSHLKRKSTVLFDWRYISYGTIFRSVEVLDLNVSDIPSNPVFKVISWVGPKPYRTAQYCTAS